MSIKNKYSLLLGIALCLMEGAPRAGAMVFDWDTLTWAGGNLTGTYDIDAANPGNDIKITIAGDTGFFNSGYPQNVTDLQGGLPTAEKNLKTDLNWTANTMAITITIDFLYPLGADLAIIKLFDVDAGLPQTVKIKGKDVEIPGTRDWQDVIKDIQATAWGGGTVYPTNVTAGPASVVTGSGSTWLVTGVAGSPSTGATSGDGNVTIDFGTNLLTQVKYTWAAGADSLSDPSLQFIGLYDFSFQPRIPEYHPGWISAGLCGLLGMFRLGRRFLPRFQS